MITSEYLKAFPNHSYVFSSICYVIIIEKKKNVESQKMCCKFHKANKSEK